MKVNAMNAITRILTIAVAAGLAHDIRLTRRVRALEDEVRRLKAAAEDGIADISERTGAAADGSKESAAAAPAALCDPDDVGGIGQQREEAADVWLCEEKAGGAVIYAYTGDEILSGTVRIPEELGGLPVTGIGRRLFYECKQIEEVVIPETVTSIGDAAFCICNNLRKINFPPGLEVIPPDCFNECGFIELDIPDTVRIIRRGAFVNNRSLRNVRLPAGLSEVELMTFAGCRALERVDIPAGVKKIGDGAFNDCSSLAEVTLPEGLEEIGMMAFLACRSLTSVHIPGTVRKTGDIAFPDTTSID